MLTPLMEMAVVFFKTVSPVEPVSFVKRICEDAANNSALKRTRFTKRLSPMTLMGRPSADDLGKIAGEVLAPHFHQQPIRSRKVRVPMQIIPNGPPGNRTLRY